MDMILSKLWELVTDRGAWPAAVHGAMKSWTWLSNWTDWTGVSFKLQGSPWDQAVSDVKMEKIIPTLQDCHKDLNKETGAYSNSCPLSQWCHPNISSSVVPFSSCPPSCLVSGSFPLWLLCIRWPKYWSFFSFSISASNDYSRLISFRTDWFDLLEVQGTLKCLPQQSG